jgi:HPt (histidine-containing phosphotransfer) domain-containing protein
MYQHRSNQTTNRDTPGPAQETVNGCHDADSSVVPVPTTWSPGPLIERLGGDEELARQLVSLFLVEYPQMVSAVRESVASGSAERIQRAAHALKGSVSNFSDGVPATAALELERIGREGRVADAPAALATVEREIEVLVTRLREFERAESRLLHGA